MIYTVKLEVTLPPELVDTYRAYGLVTRKDVQVPVTCHVEDQLFLIEATIKKCAAQVLAALEDRLLNGQQKSAKERSVLPDRAPSGSPRKAPDR